MLLLRDGGSVGIGTGLRVGSRERTRILTACAVRMCVVATGRFYWPVMVPVAAVRFRASSVAGPVSSRRRELLSGFGLSETLLALDEVGGLVAHVLVLRRLAVADDGRDDRAEHRGNDE